MYGDDEDDIWLSPSNEETFTRSDAKREALRREIKDKTGRDTAAKDLKDLKAELRPPAPPKTSDDTKVQQQEGAKTKTIQEREQDAIETAQDNPDADVMIERQQNAKQVSDEEVQSEPG